MDLTTSSLFFFCFTQPVWFEISWGYIKRIARRIKQLFAGHESANDFLPYCTISVLSSLLSCHLCMFTQYTKPIILWYICMHLHTYYVHVSTKNDFCMCLTLLWWSCLSIILFVPSLFPVSLSVAKYVELFFIPDGFCFYFLHGFSYTFISKLPKIYQYVSLFDARSALGNCRCPQNHRTYIVQQWPQRRGRLLVQTLLWLILWKRVTVYLWC